MLIFGKFCFKTVDKNAYVNFNVIKLINNFFSHLYSASQFFVQCLND